VAPLCISYASGCDVSGEKAKVHTLIEETLILFAQQTEIT
jgi:hypothetical protein